MPITKRKASPGFIPVEKWDLTNPRKKNLAALKGFLTNRKIPNRGHFINKARSLGFTATEAIALWNSQTKVMKKIKG